MRENKSFNQQGHKPGVTCSLSSSPTRLSSLLYPGSPPHQRALITEAITHARRDLGGGWKKLASGEERGRQEDKGGETLQPESVLMHEYDSKQAKYRDDHVKRQFTCHQRRRSSRRQTKNTVKQTNKKSNQCGGTAFNLLSCGFFFFPLWLDARETSPVHHGHPGTLLTYACGRNAMSGGEHGRLRDWRLRSDIL